MLFIKYLWTETIFRLFVPLLILSPVWLWYVISWSMPLPWVLVPACFVTGLTVAFFVELLLIAMGFKFYEGIWENGYLKWKLKQELPPTDEQIQLENIKQILERYVIESRIKKNNPTAQKIWEEYQTVLALTDGVKVFDEIELGRCWYKGCLKHYDELR